MPSHQADSAPTCDCRTFSVADSVADSVVAILSDPCPHCNGRATDPGTDRDRLPNPCTHS